MAAAAGVEPATCSLGESRSIQLSYATAFILTSHLRDWTDASAAAVRQCFSPTVQSERWLYTIVPFRRNSS